CGSRTPAAGQTGPGRSPAPRQGRPPRTRPSSESGRAAGRSTCCNPPAPVDPLDPHFHPEEVAPMIRPRPCSVLALSTAWAVLGLCPAHTQGPPNAAKADEKPAAQKWLLDRSLTVTPRPEPVPALAHRLFPLASERKEGNAVPIYLRLVHEQNDANRRRWVETPTKWNELPLERVPVREAREFLKGHRRMLRQLELGARRTTADWNYTLDQGDVVDVVLSDAQVMRTYAPLLVPQAP